MYERKDRMSYKIYYKDEDHRNKLKELLIKYKKVYAKYNNEVDQYYLPTFYILTSDPELRRKSYRYITDEGIKFNQMTDEQDFSSGPMELIRLAHQLFNNGDQADISRIISVLDEENFQVALQAIILKRSSYNYDEL